MKINDRVTIEGRVTGTWESKSDSPVSLRVGSKAPDVMVRVELSDKTVVDTNVTNVAKVNDAV